MKKIFFIISFFLFTTLYAQEIISYKGSKNYILKERSDLRRYDNGKYVGLVSREVSSYIIPVSDDENFLYNGIFYLIQDTKRNNVSVTNEINDVISSSFTISSDGKFEMLEDYGYPSFRSFPTFPKEKIKIGDSWNGKAERTVDPLEKGIYTKIPIYVNYCYKADTIFNEQQVFVIEANWATRYGTVAGANYIDLSGDSELEKATGNHKATMYISKISGKAIVIRDSVDETFLYKDGNQITFKGTISLFTEYPPSVEEKKLVPAIKKLTEEYTSIKYEKVPEGLKLIIEELKFKPDSAELLPSEEKRLYEIAEILKQVKDSDFLVTGHTANVGNPEGEYNLSIERAHSVAKELSKLGIDSKRFICKGFGSSKPVGDNSTPEGKAKNRRVEITILE